MATMGMCTRLARSVTCLNLVHLRSSFTKGYPWRPLSTAAETNAAEGEQKAEAKVEQAEATVSKEEEQLKEHISKLEVQFKEIEDKYKRSLAETENVRQRLKKQIDDAKLFGIQGFCKDLLDVADVLGKATETVPAEELNDSNPHLKTLFEGLTMTESQLQKVFVRHGLLKIEPPEGEKFDPHLHEALFQQPAPDKTPGTVATVEKIGYKLHDRTIRPALVGVFREP